MNKVHLKGCWKHTSLPSGAAHLPCICARLAAAEKLAEALKRGKHAAMYEPGSMHEMARAGCYGLGLIGLAIGYGMAVDVLADVVNYAHTEAEAERIHRLTNALVKPVKP